MILEGYELLEELVKLVGAERVLNDVVSWLPYEKVDEIAKDLANDYEFDWQ